MLQCWFFSADLTGSELVDQQGASLGVLPAIKAVQLGGHLVQFFIGVVELGQELRVRPLHRNTSRLFSMPQTDVSEKQSTLCPDTQVTPFSTVCFAHNIIT